MLAKIEGTAKKIADKINRRSITEKQPPSELDRIQEISRQTWSNIKSIVAEDLPWQDVELLAIIGKNSTLTGDLLDPERIELFYIVWGKLNTLLKIPVNREDLHVLFLSDETVETIHHGIINSPYTNGLLANQWQEISDSGQKLIQSHMGKGPFLNVYAEKTVNLYADILDWFGAETLIPNTVKEKLGLATKKKATIQE